MGFLNSKIQDERVLHTKYKIYSEIYILVIIICGISALLKRYVYDLTIEHMFTEFIILLAGAIYYVVRSVMLGIFSADVEMHDQKSKHSMRKKTLIYSVVFGLGIALFMGVNSAVRYAEGPGQSIEYFFITAFGSLMIYLPFFVIILVVGNEVGKRMSDKAVNKMLDADDSGDNDEKH
ncbi:DUF6773 family protein [Alteribacillus iranensis]|uniref:Uncharacterized protein n=1 Tax=Alteribacillus iranensis TaxID=930128 RepID=A0A1I2BQ52_9BACI|nr:DUF6773 family protein [Alteribacillus iranensis]SFE58276.1 hypothetical protein SAMN05192532_102445 [Alteribacillus iranensis]